MKQFLIYTLFLSFAFACKPKPEENICLTNPSECQYTSEAKAFFSFKVGSWWVYEEQTSLERDSVYVTINNENGSSYFYTETISSRDSFQTHWFTKGMYEVNGCSSSDLINKRCLYVHKTKLKGQTHLGESTIFFMKYKLGDYETTGGSTNYCQNNKIYIVNILDNININGLIINSKTVEVSENCTHFEGDQPTKFVYSKGVGLVQKKLLDSNQTWNLISYHIEP